ncbi:MAG: Ig-like domain-containing protein [Tannerellaceae bacterium]|jgi:uncharacterized protein YjdB|nr:Ig-like domain-containing protein [Tannerellaceae bacterium]
MNKKLFYALSVCCLLLMAGNISANIRRVTRTAIDNNAGSLKKEVASLADGDTIMFADELKDQVITLTGNIDSYWLDGKYVAIIGNGVVIDGSGTISINAGECRLENLIVKGSVSLCNVSRSAYIKNCAFSTSSISSLPFRLVMDMTYDSGHYSNVEVIVEGCSFTPIDGRGMVSSEWTVPPGEASNAGYTISAHFISCTFVGAQKYGDNPSFIKTSNTSLYAGLDVTLTNCVMVDPCPDQEAVTYGLNSLTSNGYNVIKGIVDDTSWSPQETDVVDATIPDPLVLHGGVYKVVADNAAYQHLPANAVEQITLPDGADFPEYDLLGNPIDYTQATHSGAIQAIGAQIESIVLKRDGEELENGGSLALATGATLPLTAEILPWDADQTISWTSSNTNVATVSTDGLVRAMQEGTTVITATTQDRRHSVSVTFSITGQAVVTGVVLDKSTLSIDSAFAKKLTASIVPTTAGAVPLSWQSDAQEIATVDNFGRVTAHAPGSALITVTASAGDAGTFTATCNVTVKPADYTTGVFVVNEDWFGHNNSTINYLYPNGNWNYRVFRTENEGHELGATSQFGAIYGGKFYIVSKQYRDPGASAIGSRLAVADAVTMKVEREHTVIADDESGTSIADGRSFLGVDETKGYVGTSNGIYILDLETQELTGERVTGTEGDPQGGDDPSLGGNAGLYTGQVGTMLRAGDRVFAIHQKAGILVIDAHADTLVTTIAAPELNDPAHPFNTHVYGSIVQSKDGNLWASVAVESSGLTPGADFILKLDPYTLDTVRVNITAGAGTGASWYAWTPDPFFAGVNENKLYWAATGNAMFDPVSVVYEYDIDRNVCSRLINLNNYDDGLWYIYSASIRIHPVTNDIYATVFRANGKNKYRTLRISSVTGLVLDTYLMEDNYWFSSLPVFPDKAEPVVSGALTDISIAEETRIWLGDKVTDDDNMDAAIMKSILPGYDATLISARVWRDSLIVAPLKEVTEATPTTLTLKFNSNGKTVQHTITVTVEANSAVVETPFELNRHTLTLDIAQTAQLRLTEESQGYTVSWRSLNENIAMVNSTGKVAGLAEGTTKIITEDVAKGKADTCVVTVRPPAVVEDPFELNTHSLTLDIAGTAQLSLTAPERYNVSWRSLNEDVAMVGNAGKVRGIAEGTTKVIAEDVVKGKADTCVVTVRPAPIEYTIGLNHSVLVMNAGERMPLQATVSPDVPKQTVTWTASDPGVGDVTASGTVVAIMAGYSVITASLPDGTSASCRVTVRDLPIAPEVDDVKSDEVTLSFPKLSGTSYYMVHLYEVAGGERTPVVALQVNPEGTVISETRLRASDNTIHLTLKDLKAASHYEADIDVVREIDGKAEVVSVLHASFTTGSPTGIDSPTGNQAKVYYENGSLRLVNLEGYTCRVVTLSGQRLQSYRVTLPEEMHHIRLSSGVYILTAEKPGDRKTFKFVVLP